MSVTVITEYEHRTFTDADDFTAERDTGYLIVKTTNDEGELVVLHAVYAPGRWLAAVNDDAVPVTR